MGLASLGDKTVLIVGVMATGLADAFANAVGFHISEETEKFHTGREVLSSTTLCFGATLLVFLILLIPLIFLPLSWAIWTAWGLGIALIVKLSVTVAQIRGMKRIPIVLEYTTMCVTVSIICHLLGQLVARG
jgi:VIT1/CCC1 family predicted Fe2+/Mn2+ transporter